jgi:UDP-N-acetyl-D-glucosamine dehydrogenase
MPASCQKKHKVDTLPIKTQQPEKMIKVGRPLPDKEVNSPIHDSSAISCASNGLVAPSSHFQPLLDKIQNRHATIGVLGMGYVGLPLVMAFAGAGFRTVGFDTNERTVAALQNGESHIGDVPADVVQAMRSGEKFLASTDFSHLKDCDIAIICVPTPLTEMREPDLGAVKAASAAIQKYLHAGQLVILESTTYPGTTDEIVRPLLEETGFRAGRDFYLAFSPERIDPGNEAFPIHKVPKVVGGHTAECGRLAVELYAAVVEHPVPVSSTQAAELTKLLENIFRCVNIALVNEMAMLCDRMDIDIWEVIDAAATKPYGFTKFLPGPGLGGHCIPIDPFYLSWKARQYQFQTNFIELAGEVNTAMPRYVIEKIMRSLNDEGKAVKGSKIGLLGMSYKANVGDCRESPSLMVAELLHNLGAELHFYDPYVQNVKLFHNTAREFPFAGSTLEEVLECDCVVLLTNHRDYPYQQIVEQTKLIIDTRNAFKDVEGSARIVKL